ncbi:MAG: hypothetical protein PHD33_03095 [Atribacterota bacterium]|nr:hypothetical protein [Atribacterota bacterium]
MKNIMLIEENNQFQRKNHKVSFYIFLFIIFVVGLMVIGYICSNIALMKLGYQSIDLEQKRDYFLKENAQMEYSVECLSSLTRIEQIACEELGMRRAENIEFIAMVPAKINTEMVASKPAGEMQQTDYLEAGSLFREFASLQIFRNQ